MREQSHIDDMRAAIRGDLERARARRPSIFERPAVSPEAGIAAETEAIGVVESAVPEVPAPDVAAERPRRPGLVARLFGGR